MTSNYDNSVHYRQAPFLEQRLWNKFRRDEHSKDVMAENALKVRQARFWENAAHTQEIRDRKRNRRHDRHDTNHERAEEGGGLFSGIMDSVTNLKLGGLGGALGGLALGGLMGHFIGGEAGGGYMGAIATAILAFAGMAFGSKLGSEYFDAPSTASTNSRTVSVNTLAKAKAADVATQNDVSTVASIVSNQPPNTNITGCTTVVEPSSSTLVNTARPTATNTASIS